MTLYVNIFPCGFQGGNWWFARSPKFTWISGVPGCAQDSSWLSRMAYDMSQIAPELIHAVGTAKGTDFGHGLPMFGAVWMCLVYLFCFGDFEFSKFSTFEILDVGTVIQCDPFDLVRLLCDLRDHAPQHHCGTDRGFLPNPEAGPVRKDTCKESGDL